MSAAQERSFIAPHAVKLIYFTLKTLCQFAGKLHDHLQGAMVKLDIFNQPLIVARQNRGSADMFPKGLSLPFEIRFPAIGGFVCELDGFIHAAGCDCEESRDGFNADTGTVQYRSVKRRIGSKSLAEFGGAIFF